MPANAYRDNVAGVTFRNEDGTCRQKILRQYARAMVTANPRLARDNRDPNAFAVVTEFGQIGYLFATNR